MSCMSTPSARMWAHDLIQWKKKPRDILEIEMDRPCHPWPYREETKMTTRKIVEKTTHDSSTSLLPYTLYCARDEIS